MQYAIEFQDVYRHFDTQEVLRGLSLKVREGQIYALLGRNGTGKTTALRILMGRLHPHLGRSCVLGTDSLEFGPLERGAIGYITEGHKLYKELSIKKTLAFEEGTRPGFHTQFAKDALGRMGIPLKKTPWQLSRGQKAQLSLVLTMAAAPKVLVLDDPALGLDVVLRREFLDAMIDFLAGKGSTVLYSSHILTDVERIADRVGILQGGRLRMDADLEDIKTRVQLCQLPLETGANLLERPEVMHHRRVRGAVEVSLRDATPETLAALAQATGSTIEPINPSLEDLFLHLTQADHEQVALSPIH